MIPLDAPAGMTAFLAAERTEAEAALRRAIEYLWPDAGTPLAAAIRYALEGGGKRLRPILCVAAWRACSGNGPAHRIHDLAATLELIHTYSLVHDDLPCMDDDVLRRGRPTAHRVFGSAAATLAGAAMIPAAFAWLERAARELGLDPPRRAILARTLARGAGAGGMVGGQVLDLAAEGGDFDVDTLEGIHRRKTAALFAAATRLGALCARAPDDVVGAMGDYGLALGLAFQVADDLLDETGDTGTLGKDAGRDRALDKATFPALLGVDDTRAKARDAVAAARAALRAGGIRDALLEDLARFAIERDR